MATDYVLFIHGVDTRYEGTPPDYADKLFALIKQHVQSTSRSIEPLVVYWGGVTDEKEGELLQAYKASPIWDKLWFQPMREAQMLRFVGDTALYLSRYIGGKVADIVAQDIAKLKNSSSEDRLHLVTHSLGTVILFDLLFSARWDQVGTCGHDSVMAIRDAIYGTTGNSGNPKQGIRLGSISTMGSPIGLFSLMDVDQRAVDATNERGDVICTHDITPRLEQLLDYLHQALGGKKVPWRNFVHPGDPVACPLEAVVPNMVDGRRAYIDIRDELVPANLIETLAEPLLQAFLDTLAEPVRQTFLALLRSGDAHLSYLDSKHVAQEIAQLIQQSRAG